MAQVSSGKILRETRERKGYDLTTVARRLRIRPDILRAIEAGDFSTMPPQGYTRNMVNAYARILGLNPTEIVNMYLDEAYAHQVERARNAGPGGTYGLERESRRNRVRPRNPRATSDTGSVYGDLDNPNFESGDQRISRHLYDDRTQYSRDDYGTGRIHVDREERSSRDYRSHHSNYPTSNYNIYDDRHPNRRGRQIRVGNSPMSYSSRGLSGLLQSRLILIIIIVVIVIALIALGFLIFGRGGGDAQDDVTALPVSGISDTTGAADGEDEEDLSVEVAPTAARIAYSVAAGDSVYIETYADGEGPTPEMLDGPVEQTTETTGTWTITTFTPDLITVTVNGEKVELKVNEDYGGMYSYTVDFPAMLEEWRKTHTSKSSQRQAAVADAANAANQDSSSAASDTGNQDTDTGGDTQS